MNSVWAKLLNKFVNKQLNKQLPKLMPDSVRQGFKDLDDEVKNFTKKAIAERLADNDWGTTLKHNIDGTMNTIGTATQKYTENLIKAIGLDDLSQKMLNSDLLTGDNFLQEEVRRQIDRYLTAGGIGEIARKELLKKVREETIIQDGDNVYYNNGKFNFTF